MNKPTGLKTLYFYKDQYGHEPFEAWLNALKDQKGRRTILKRLRRLEQGLYGDCESVGEGVLELRIFFGPGCRIYFGEESDRLVIILCGGDKSSQKNDIKQAKNFLEGAYRAMKNYRTLDQVETQYFIDHPDEINDYVTEIFIEYSQDHDTKALLASLRVIARVKGISALAEETGITRKGIQKALSEEGNPKFESINAIMNAMGYQLMPQQMNVR